MTRPPLPPAARLDAPPAPHQQPEPHSIPGWVGGLIYLFLIAVLVWTYLGKMHPELLG